MSVSPTTTTIYYAQTRNTTTGCVSACTNVTVTVTALPAIPAGITASPATICNGLSSTISVTNPGAGLTTDWFTGSCGGTPVAGGTGVNSLSVSPTTTTIYYAQTRNTTTGCVSACTNVTVTVTALPAIPAGIAASPATICNGLSSTISVTNPGAGLTTDWFTGSCGGTPVAGGTGVNSLSVSPTTTTIYYAQTRNTTTGCVSACTNVTVTVTALPAIPAGITASPTTICNGLSSTISVNNPGAGLTTDWFTGSCGGTPVAGGTGVNSLSVSPTTTTIYYAQTRNTTTGCVSACTNVTVTVTALPAIPAGITASPTTICNGLSSTISVNNPGAGLTTDWFTGSCGGTPVAGGTGVNSLSVSPTTTTIYYAQTRNTTTGCVSACTNVTVTVNALAATPTGIAANPAAICNGGSSTISVTNPGAGLTTDWFTVSCGGTPVAGGTGVNSLSVSPTTTTIYYAQTRNTITGCVSACTNVTVTVTALPAIPTGIAASPATICNGLSSTISVTNPGAGLTTDWFTVSCGGTPVAGGTGVNSLSVSPTTTTIYYAQTRNTTTGCVSTCTNVTVTVNALAATPTGIAANPAAICNGGSSTISVTNPGAGYTTDWYTVSCGGTAVAGGTGINSLLVSPTTTTIYYAQTRNTTTGCVSACTNVTVTVNALAATPTGIAANPAAICNGGSSTISVTNPGAGLTTDWFTVSCGGTPVAGGTGVNSLSVSPTTTTIYYAQTRNTITGCVSACTNVTVTVNALAAAPTGIAASPATICNGLSSTISVTNPGAGLTTDWFTVSCGGTPVAGGTGVNSLSVSPTTTTIYYAHTRNTITGCVSACTNVTITVNALPTANISGTASICTGGNALLTSNATAGSGTITSYQWNLGGTPISGATLATYTASAAGSYTITITNSNGCSFLSSPFVVTVNALPTANITGTASFCTGGNTLLASNAAAGSGTITNYQWNLGGIPISGASAATYTAFAAGSYTVTITNNNGCSFTSNAFVVTVNAFPAANITGAASFCTFGNTLLTSNATSGSGTITNYQWNLGGASISGATSANYTAAAAGSYTVTISNSNGCSFTSNAFIVSENTLPTANITGTASFCTGGNTLLASNAAPGSGTITNYQWNLAGVSINGATSSNYTAAIAGSYTVTITNSNGCSFTSTPFILIVNALPTANITGTASFCTGGNTLLTSNATAGSGTITNYRWNLGGAPISGATASTYTATAAGSYTVTITNSSGCSFTSNAFALTINALPTANITGTSTFCTGENTLLTSNAAAGSGTITNYRWNLGGVPISGATAASYTAAAAGSYTVTITNSNGCSFTSSAVTITVNALPVAPTASITVQPTCIQPTGTIIITSSTTGLTFSLDGTAYTSYPAGGYTFVSPGPHILTAQNANNCISNVTNVSVNPVPNGPTDVATTTVNASCGLSNGTITLGSVTSGTAPYTYSVDASVFTISISYSGMAAGPHSVQVRDANGCIYSTSVIVSNSSGPTAIAATPANASCGLSNGTITLGAVTGGLAPYTYSVDASAFTASTSYTGIAAGPHSIQVKDANSCIFSTNVTISNASGPTAIATTPASASCGLSNGTLMLGAVTGGTTPYTYSVDASAFTVSTSYSGMAEGSHSVQVRDANGCIFSTSVAIGNASGPTDIVATTANASCGLNNGTFTLYSVTGGTSPYTYSVDASAFTASTSYSGMSAGPHSVKVRDANGCIFSTSVTISNASGPTDIAATPANASCGQSNGTITLGAVAGGTAPFTYSIDTSAFSPLTFYSGIAAGPHSVQVRDVNGCIFSTSVTISNVGGPTAIVATPANASCGLSNGSIILGTITGGTAPFTYSVDASVFTPSTFYSGMAAGPHSVQVRDANGCIFPTSVTISNASGPTAIVSTSDSASCGQSNGTITLGAVTGGAAPYTYSVDSSAFTTSTSYSAMAEGPHSVQVRDANGCIFSTSVTIIQAVNTLKAPITGTITQPTCSLATGKVILSGLPELTWTINPGSITGTGSTTTISGLTTGKYNFTVTNAEGCISPASTAVIILAVPGLPTAPIVDQITQSSCILATGSVILTGLPASIWTINPGSITGTGSATTISGLAAGTYNYTVTNAEGCISPSSADVVITQTQGPTADFSFSLACLGLPTYFFDHSDSYPDPLTFWGWVVKDSVQTVGDMTGVNTTFTFERKGSYSVIHTVYNSAGCYDSKTYKVTVYPSPLSVFSLEDNYQNIQGKILLQNESVGADEYFWDFGNNETSTEASPVITYNENGDFLIQLFSRNSYDCVDSSSIIYNMLFKGLWVPNAISPGAVSAVSIWKPVGENLSSYKAEIYDRWGKLLWSSDKLENGIPSEGWDGKYNGSLCNEGAYIWKISATFKDGSIWPNAKVDYRQNVQDSGSGTVTLIR